MAQLLQSLRHHCGGGNVNTERYMFGASLKDNHVGDTAGQLNISTHRTVTACSSTIQAQARQSVNMYR